MFSKSSLTSVNSLGIPVTYRVTPLKQKSQISQLLVSIHNYLLTYHRSSSPILKKQNNKLKLKPPKQETHLIDLLCVLIIKQIYMSDSRMKLNSVPLLSTSSTHPYRSAPLLGMSLPGPLSYMLNSWSRWSSCMGFQLSKPLSEW